MYCKDKPESLIYYKHFSYYILFFSSKTETHHATSNQATILAQAALPLINQGVEDYNTIDTQPFLTFRFYSVSYAPSFCMTSRTDRAYCATGYFSSTVLTVPTTE